MSRLSPLLLLALLVAWPPDASAQAPCRVLDPELQGSYSGGCRDGLAEGFGKAAGAARYEGEFRAGRRHGWGVQTWPSGERYEGPWENGAMTGAATPRMAARARARAEHVAAVGQVGVRVCRDFPVGIAIRDRVRGTVTNVEGDRIEVRISDPGAHQHRLHDMPVARDLIIRDDLFSWWPCR
jgi:hypothetical protein